MSDWTDAFNLVEYGNVPAGTQAEFNGGDSVNTYTDFSTGLEAYVIGRDTNGDLRVLEAVWGAPNSFNNDTTLPSGTSAASISTQQLAQQALETINNAIISKDNIRANLGALQNRLENTISNLEIQAENLQAAESRISDVDVSLEMTNFVRKQILTQAAVAMLSQANSLPRMAMQLLGGNKNTAHCNTDCTQTFPMPVSMVSLLSTA